MSENLSSGSGGSENLVSPPQRAPKAAPPAPPAPRRNPAAARPANPSKQSDSAMADEKAKLLKKMKLSKPGLKDNKKQD